MMRPWRNPGEVGPDAGEGVLEEVHWAAANLLRWLGLATEQRSTTGMAAQGSARRWCDGAAC